MLLPYDEGARLAELYAQGAPIQERVDRPEGAERRAADDGPGRRRTRATIVDPVARDALRKAYRAAVKDRTPEQVALLKANPSVMSLSAGSLYLYDTTYKTKYAAELKAILEHPEVPRVLDLEALQHYLSLNHR